MAVCLFSTLDLLLSLFLYAICKKLIRGKFIHFVKSVFRIIFAVPFKYTWLLYVRSKLGSRLQFQISADYGEFSSAEIALFECNCHKCEVHHVTLRTLNTEGEHLSYTPNHPLREWLLKRLIRTSVPREKKINTPFPLRMLKSLSCPCVIIFLLHCIIIFTTDLLQELMSADRELNETAVKLQLLESTRVSTAGSVVPHGSSLFNFL